LPFWHIRRKIPFSLPFGGQNYKNFCRFATAAENRLNFIIPNERNFRKQIQGFAPFFPKNYKKKKSKRHKKIPRSVL
jgi:hypothetical protein